MLRLLDAPAAGRLRAFDRQGDKFVAFAVASLAACSEKLREPVAANDAQSAIDALRNKNLVCRSQRGVYTL
jgi:hypothetical protein